MFPSINILNKTISLYAIMAILGILFCGWYAVRLSKKNEIDDNITIEVLLVSCIGVFLGGHILYGITNFSLIIELLKNIGKIENFSTLINCILEIFGGSVFYGGLIGGLIFGFIYMKKKKVDIPKLCDMLTPLIPLFHTFGRIGCFLSGCCYGIQSKVGFKYTHALIESANGVNRFPIQLVEAGYNLILFFILSTLYKKSKFKSNLLYLYLFLYSIARFAFEFFRGDSYRGFLFGLSTSQIISIVLFIFSSIMLIKYILTRKKEH